MGWGKGYMAGDKMGSMKLVVSLWLLVVGYFLWWGAVNPVWEGDSLAYHIPIAGMMEDGGWMDRKNFKLPFYYYPAMGETLLAGWMTVGLPANWFNLAGWVVLAGVVYRLGRVMGLEKETATVAAAAMVMWPSVIRLIPTQTVDIWVGVWWGAALLQLTINNSKFTTKKQIYNLIWTGVYMGMLAGTKYSGPAFAAILIVFFRDKLRNHVRYWLVPLVLIGGFWYARNWILTGNPVYPLDVSWLGWRGESGLTVFTGKPLWTLIDSPGLMAEALVSEYLVWAGLLLLPLVVRNRWVWLGLVNFGVYLLLPSRPENIVSDLRYIYPAMIPLLLEGGKWMAENGRKEIFVLAAWMMMAVTMTQLDYHPKLFLFLILGIIAAWKFQDPNFKIQINTKL